MRGACVTLAKLESGGVDGAALLTELTSVKKSMLQIILNSKQHLFETNYTPAAHHRSIRQAEVGVDLCPSSGFSNELSESTAAAAGEGRARRSEYNEVHCELRSACSSMKLEKNTQDKSRKGKLCKCPNETYEHAITKKPTEIMFKK